MFPRAESMFIIYQSVLIIFPQVLAFLSTSPDLLDFPGQRLDAPSPLHGFMERYKGEIEEMQQTMLLKEKKEMEMGQRWESNLDHEHDSADTSEIIFGA